MESMTAANPLDLQARRDRTRSIFELAHSNRVRLTNRGPSAEHGGCAHFAPTAHFVGFRALLRNENALRLLPSGQEPPVHSRQFGGFRRNSFRHECPDVGAKSVKRAARAIAPADGDA